jgi:hypothetical protein
MPAKETCQIAPRRSARLGSQKPNDPEIPLPTTEAGRPVSETTSDPEDPSEEPDNAMSDDNLIAEMALMRQTIQRLERELVDKNGGTRASTPADSAFGGTAYKPTGMAAKPAFTAFPDGKNNKYNDKSKARGKDPTPFEGDTEAFDLFVYSVADKFEEDETTFRTEKSRMAYLMNLLVGRARTTLATRYMSDDNPFSGVAEMIQTLEAAYHDKNQASSARDKLRKMSYRLGQGQTIHEFMGEFNAVTAKAGVRSEDMKITLWEHIPPNLDTRLHEDAQDTSISYEKFCKSVASAAFSAQRAWDVRQERQKKEGRPPNDKGGRRDNKPRGRDADYKKPSFGDYEKLSAEDRDKHKKQGTCFGCGVHGHILANCPNKEDNGVKALRKTLAKEDKQDDQDSDDGPASGKD